MLNTVLFTVREGVLQSGSSIGPENDSGLWSEKEVRTNPVSSSACLQATKCFVWFLQGSAQSLSSHLRVPAPGRAPRLQVHSDKTHRTPANSLHEKVQLGATDLSWKSKQCKQKCCLPITSACMTRAIPWTEEFKYLYKIQGSETIAGNDLTCKESLTVCSFSICT